MVVKIDLLYLAQLWGNSMSDLERGIYQYYERITGREQSKIKQFFNIHYYRYDNRIQYYLTYNQLNESCEYILLFELDSRRQDCVEINKELFEKGYFESPFKEFKSFFLGNTNY